MLNESDLRIDSLLNLLQPPSRSDEDLRARNVLTIKKALRHRAIQSTMKYIGMLKFENEDYEVATGTTVDEIKQLAEAGFQKFDEVNGIHIFRKPKKFNSLQNTIHDKYTVFWISNYNSRELYISKGVFG
jgi:hypothetical protein